MRRVRAGGRSWRGPSVAWPGSWDWTKNHEPNRPPRFYFRPDPDRAGRAPPALAGAATGRPAAALVAGGAGPGGSLSGARARAGGRYGCGPGPHLPGDLAPRRGGRDTPGGGIPAPLP